MSLFALRTCLRRPVHMQPPLVPSRTRALSRTSTPTLPRLPVPDLHKTLQKYLKSIEPFLLEDEKRKWRVDHFDIYRNCVEMLEERRATNAAAETSEILDRVG